ncbi:hypothetical protein [Agromyces sp. Marseille-Q5079]|uniref:hypothetical protein n=1 Tax=Agromyces sp. Marseille-Q5079 TaxID=3439059 RepID=UPI003D9C9705
MAAPSVKVVGARDGRPSVAIEVQSKEARAVRRTWELTAGIGLVIGSVGLLFVRAFSGRGNGWADIADFLPYLAIGVGGALIYIAIYGGYARARDTRLADRLPGAVVFGAELTPTLKRLLRASFDAEIGTELYKRIPHRYTLVVDCDFVAFWYGRPSAPKLLRRFETRSFRDVQATTFLLPQKRMEGLMILGSGSNLDASLEIAPSPTGVMAKSRTRPQVELLAGRLRSCFEAAHIRD